MQDKKSNKSALSEVDGVKQPNSTSTTAIQKIKLNRRKQPSVKVFVSKILEGDITHLSKAITLIESQNIKHQNKARKIITACLPFANTSIRIGITGVPGVGKSTFIETFGKHLTSLGKKVAVLAIDPSSSINKGSILGDKTRMEDLVKDQNAFIRPSPSGKSLGGVAQKTRETIILCEAAGFDTIFIETVGVGQSETVVHSMVDFFLLLKLAGAGDELQGIKRGIIEMADAIVINKADNDNEKSTELARSEFTRALHLYPLKKSQWQPKVTTCSAFYNKGIDTIWNIIEDYIILTKSNHYFDEKRAEQNQFWLLDTINQTLKTHFYEDSIIKKQLQIALKAVNSQKTSPFEAANKLLDLYFKIIKTD
jgi:LAO/AO transport system kinase